MPTNGLRVVFSLVCASGCGGSLPVASPPSRAEAIIDRHGCTTLPGVTITVLEPVSADLGCALTRVGIAAIGAGHGAPIGLLPADSASVTRSHILFMEFTDLQGGPPARYWDVSLTIPDRDIKVNVYVSADSDTVQVRLAEEAFE